MSDREMAMQLLDSVPEYKLGYVVAYLQGIIVGEEEPNEETMEAFAEIEELKEKDSLKEFDNPGDLWDSLEA